MSLGIRYSIIIKISLLGFCTFALASCFPERWTWNQKLIVEVQTPSGLRTGAAVVEVAWNDVNSVGNYPGSYKGEATVVKLGDGKYLFALLGEGTRYLAFRTFNNSTLIKREIFEAMEKVRGVKTVIPRDYPMLVTFDDITKPETIREVKPQDLAATFGAGYSLKSITLQITNEPVSKDRIESLLDWWCEYRGQYLVDRYAEIVSNEFARNIGAGHFRIGECK